VVKVDGDAVARSGGLQDVGETADVTIHEV
jgi:hypothetical protein